MAYRSNDPVADFERWDRDQQQKLDQLPHCCYCDKPIQQEKAVCINDEWYCDSCLDEHFRRTVENY